MVPKSIARQSWKKTAFDEKDWLERSFMKENLEIYFVI
jgi:hypothetical protein